MQKEYLVPWNDDLEEFVFTSHTSIISKELLYQKLVEHDLVEAGLNIDDLNNNKKVSNGQGSCM